MSLEIMINCESFYQENAKVADIPVYIQKSIELAGDGNIITLTGKAPIWMYLSIAHALHGKAKKLYYTSPATGEIMIFDHNAF